MPPAAQALAFIVACIAFVAIPVALYEGGKAVFSSQDSGPAPQTLKKAMWGPTVLPDGRSSFPTMRDLGVGIYETQVHWYETATRRPADPTNPRDPAYTWPAGLAEAIAAAKRNGMEVSIMLIGAPKWANGGKDWMWTPKNPKDFGDFATAAAKRYPDVHLWMIWGEPNRAPNYQPLTPASNNRTGPLTRAQQVAPRNYAEITDAAYGALKAVSPKNKVIAGDTFTSAGPDAIYTYQWLQYMKLANGKRPRFDMWGHNPYGFRRPEYSEMPSKNGIVAFQDLQRLEQALDKAYPGKELPLFLSEWGVPIGFEDKDLLYSKDEDTGKSWIESGYEIARDDPRIYTLGWIHLLDDVRSSQGLLDIKGNKKPSYGFYKDS
jgi:hypothetical protein